MSDAWSTEEDERLRSLARSGLSIAEIAQQMQRSKPSIRARATKLTIAIARDRNPQTCLKALRVAYLGVKVKQ
jgi:DNA-binding NarL/FixJ family response regulator